MDADVPDGDNAEVNLCFSGFQTNCDYDNVFCELVIFFVVLVIGLLICE